MREIKLFRIPHSQLHSMSIFDIDLHIYSRWINDNKNGNLTNDVSWLVESWYQPFMYFSFHFTTNRTAKIHANRTVFALPLRSPTRILYLSCLFDHSDKELDKNLRLKAKLFWASNCNLKKFILSEPCAMPCVLPALWWRDDEFIRLRSTWLT